MRRIAHLSDLHFGRVRPELARPLVAAVKRADPDLVVVSGDFTQRARESQYRDARAFLDQLPGPQLCVPGNHDVPLDNPAMRALRPWARYRRWISRELEPQWHDDVMSVVGANTVSPREWQRGRISSRRLARLCDALETAGADGKPRLRVLVAHHPVEQRPEDRKTPMKGGERAARALTACGADVVLAGHLHSWRAAPFAAGGTLQVQAGTSLSERLRGEENDFNLLTVTPDEVTVDRYVAGLGHDFEREFRSVFRRSPDGWLPVEGPHDP